MPRRQVIADDVMSAKNEEKSNLEKIEKTIEEMTAVEKAALNKKREEISGFLVFDNDDLHRKQYLIDQANKLEGTVNELSSYVDSPYFGRFDMYAKGKNAKTYFVGKKALNKGSNIIILDWRSPIGNTFYNKQEHRFNVENEEYELLLRRAVDIKNAKLISVTTEFDSANLSLEGEVIDEFLISVLKDKRRDYKLTDIIRSIQANQNNIINKPIDESFVVQGCAGSGKTMILLHRLSFIAFNYPKTNFSSFYILTPNENFNVHVNELSSELGLDKIKRVTVEEFYANMITALSRGDSVIRGGKNRPKITATTTDLHSEKPLNNNLLRTLYSDAFFAEVSEEYNTKAVKTARKVDELNVIEILGKYHYVVRPFTRMDYGSYLQLSTALSGLLSKYTKASKGFSTANAELLEIEAKLESIKKECSSLDETLESAKAAIMNQCKEQISELSSIEESTKESLHELRKSIDSAQKEKAQLFEQIQRTEASLEIISHKREKLSDANYLTVSSDEIAEEIRAACETEFSTIREISAQLETLAVYNFGRRARMRTELNEAEQKLAEKSRETIEQYRLSKVSEVAEKRNRISELETIIESTNLGIADLKSGNKYATETLNAYRTCLTILETESTPNLASRLTDTEKEIIGNDVKIYIWALSELAGKKRVCKEMETSADHLKSEAERYKANLIDEEDAEVLNNAMEIVKEFDMISLKRSLERRLRKLYEEYNQNYSSTVNYRHKLYLKLLLCTLYYGSYINSGLHINIDEAQDLAITEYRLLKFALGEKTVFNLFGDVNQTVYEYKGINDWSEIDSIFTGNLYFLNENYRNTLQITEYCNRKFYANITAVGLNGNDVIETDFSNALSTLQKLRKDNPEYRIAVIYKRGLYGLESAIRKTIQAKCVFNQIDNQAFSIITVEEAKGLEFDAVVVIENYMTINEKYVAYTRALDNLIITNMENSAFVIHQDEPKDPDEVFADNQGITEELGEPEEAEEPEEPEEPLPDLPEKPVNVGLENGRGYIEAFFAEESEMRETFKSLAEYVCGTDSEIILRVCKDYIGLGKPTEKTRIYVAKNNGVFTIKFAHLFAKDMYDSTKLEEYMSLYDQCALNVKQYPITLRGAL